MNIAVNTQCAWPAIGWENFSGHNVPMLHTRRKTYLREWRKKSGRTLVQVAEYLHMTHGQLSKIELGKQPYNQNLLEALAELYECDVTDLLSRHPDVEWDDTKILQFAKPDEMKKIISIARTIMGLDDNAA